MNILRKDSFKELLAEFPLTAELYWYLRQAERQVDDGLSLDDLRSAIPRWCDQAAASANNPLSAGIS
jgi:hypothetical protein